MTVLLVPKLTLPAVLERLELWLAGRKILLWPVLTNNRLLVIVALFTESFVRVRFRITDLHLVDFGGLLALAINFFFGTVEVVVRWDGLLLVI